jgi:hypothetical protein
VRLGLPFAENLVDALGDADGGVQVADLGLVVPEPGQAAVSADAVQPHLQDPNAWVPRRLRDVGVMHDALPEIINYALDDWAITRVPRPASRGNLRRFSTTGCDRRLWKRTPQRCCRRGSRGRPLALKDKFGQSRFVACSR